MLDVFQNTRGERVKRYQVCDLALGILCDVRVDHALARRKPVANLFHRVLEAELKLVEIFGEKFVHSGGVLFLHWPQRHRGLVFDVEDL